MLKKLELIEVGHETKTKTQEREDRSLAPLARRRHPEPRRRRARRGRARSDRELARRYDLVREEMSETIQLNEMLGAPSARAMDRLFAAIDAEGATTRERRSFDLAAFVAERLLCSPRTLAWSAAAAVLAIVVQAGVLAGMFLTEQKGGAQYQTASYEESRPVTAQHGGEPVSGTFVLVRFNPNASVSEITRFFGVNKASLVEGPRSGGLYRLRVSDKPLSSEEMDQVVTKLRTDTGVIAFIVPTR